MIYIFISEISKPMAKTVSLADVLRQLVAEKDRLDINFSTRSETIIDISFYEPLMSATVEAVRERVQRSKEVERIFIFGEDAGAYLAVSLCQCLKKLEAHKIEINVCLLQPMVPFAFEYPPAVKNTFDLRSCTINALLLLYKSWHIGTAFSVTPIVPQTCKPTKVTIDVIPGDCDQDSGSCFNKGSLDCTLNTAVLYHQAVDFLRALGAELKFSQLNLPALLAERGEIAKLDLLTKVMHRLRGRNGRIAMVDGLLVRQTYGKPYLNNYHMELAGCLMMKANAILY